MADLDLDAIEKRAAAATPGPWKIYYGRDAQEILSESGNGFVATMRGIGCGPRGNAAFLAHARTDIPALVARVRKLEAELGAARERACEQETALSDAAMQIATLQSMLQAAPVYHAARCGLMDPGAYDRQCTCAQGAFLARRAALLGGGAL